MQEAEFTTRIEQTLESLELALDEVDGDIEYENSGGVLTVEFENGSTMVFSRQLASLQLWLATSSGGFHFEFDEAEADWRCTRSGALFKPFVVEQMRLDGNVILELE
ncbi:MAG: iron donor protein CyaY [Gammaproteobacteria bacterium]|nr:iron donor protein CyaY [Gammaproteobacteria bacterium]